MRPEHEQAKQWLVKAEHDLRAAALALGAQPPITDVSAFHSQQAAEKALKAFLVHHVVAFDFVHDLQYLLDLCARMDGSLDDLAEAAAILTPYAVKFRYPSGSEPTFEQATTALEFAVRVVEAVQGRL